MQLIGIPVAYDSRHLIHFRKAFSKGFFESQGFFERFSQGIFARFFARFFRKVFSKDFRKGFSKGFSKGIFAFGRSAHFFALRTRPFFYVLGFSRCDSNFIFSNWIKFN